MHSPSRQRGSQPQAEPANTAAANDRPEDDLECFDEFDDLDGDADDLPEMMLGLPLGEENFATGEPLVTVDYFGFAGAAREGIADRLLALDGAVTDEGADSPRILVFDAPRADGALQPLDLVAIATVREHDLRVETARRDLTDHVRRRVESALGLAVRHLRRVAENPIEAFISG